MSAVGFTGLELCRKVWSVMEHVLRCLQTRRHEGVGEVVQAESTVSEVMKAGLARVWRSQQPSVR